MATHLVITIEDFLVRVGQECAAVLSDKVVKQLEDESHPHRIELA